MGSNERFNIGLANFSAILELGYEWQDYAQRPHRHIDCYGEIEEPKANYNVFLIHHVVAFGAIAMNVKYAGYDYYT